MSALDPRCGLTPEQRAEVAAIVTASLMNFVDGMRGLFAFEYGFQVMDELIPKMVAEAASVPPGQEPRRGTANG